MYRSLELREQLYVDVCNLRDKGFSYARIIEQIRQTHGTLLAKSNISDWVNGNHEPLGKVHYFTAKATPQLAYIIGVRFGDLTLWANQKIHNYRMILRAIDKEFVEEFNRCVSFVLKCREHSIGWDEERYWRVEIQSVMMYRFLSQPFRLLKKYVEHCGKCAAAFLRGFFDSEGSISGRNLVAYNTLLSILRYAARLLKTRFGIETGKTSLSHPAGTRRIINDVLCVSRKDCYVVRVKACGLDLFQKHVNFTIRRKVNALESACRKG